MNMKTHNGWLGRVGMLGMVAAVLSLGAPMPAKAQVTTNEPTTGMFSNAPVSTVIGFAFSLLPQWQRGANYFTNDSLEIKVAPLWKTAAAAGSTPYLSAGADYWFKTWTTVNGDSGGSSLAVSSTSVGVGGEMVTLGNGAGSDTVDSVSAYLEARRSIGNLAGYVMLGGERDINGNRFAFEFGPGVEIRYASGLGLFLDTRLVEPFSGGGGNGGHVDWLTRFGVSLHF
jgi:hypothetical protein